MPDVKMHLAGGSPNRHSLYYAVLINAKVPILGIIRGKRSASVAPWPRPMRRGRRSEDAILQISRDESWHSSNPVMAAMAGRVPANGLSNPENGQVLTGSFMDYAMPRVSNTCRVDMTSHPVRTHLNPLGVKGVGECGTVGALAAVMNGINDALAPFGVRNLAMPATPERIWRAIHSVKGQPDLYSTD